MKIFGFSLTTWIKHPILAWDAFERRYIPVVNLDYPEFNCDFCGFDHHSEEREDFYSDRITKSLVVSKLRYRGKGRPRKTDYMTLMEVQRQVTDAIDDRREIYED